MPTVPKKAGTPNLTVNYKIAWANGLISMPIKNKDFHWIYPKHTRTDSHFYLGRQLADFLRCQKLTNRKRKCSLLLENQHRVHQRI